MRDNPPLYCDADHDTQYAWHKFQENQRDRLPKYLDDLLINGPYSPLLTKLHWM